MQNWQVNLMKKCSDMNLEAISTLDGLTIICPKIPGKKDKTQILSVLPEDIREHISFTEGPKPSTLNHMRNTIIATGVVGSMGNNPPDLQRKYLKITMTGNGNPDAENTDWSPLSDLLMKDGYFESWDIVFNNKTVAVYDRKVSKELQKNKSRDTVIQKDDILDLNILLNTEMDFDKLLEKL